MVVASKLAAALLLCAASASALGADANAHASMPSRREALDMTEQGLRLVKTSDEDPGTWMTEEEKFEKLISKKIGFMDITETMELESLHVRSLEEGTSAKRQSSFPSGPTHQSVANPLIAQARQANLQTWANGLAAIYNRYYRGSYSATSAQWVYDTVVSAASANSAITVRRVTHSFNQPSVIATIPGRGSGVVVVSAHFDSIGTTTSGRAPGADDNASGVVTILEALRVLAAARFAPGNQLEFHFYAGEEGGLLGSRDIMQSYASAGTDVLAVMNQDMTGFSPNNVIAVYTDYVDAGLTNFMKTLVPVYSTLPLATDSCGYGCSDHASARAAGFPAAYVCDEVMADSSPYIHSAQDTISTLSFPHILEHTKLTIGFLVEGSYF